MGTETNQRMRNKNMRNAMRGRINSTLNYINTAPNPRAERTYLHRSFLVSRLRTQISHVLIAKLGATFCK
jgi:hypothetical protein